MADPTDPEIVFDEDTTNGPVTSPGQVDASFEPGNQLDANGIDQSQIELDPTGQAAPPSDLRAVSVEHRGLPGGQKRTGSLFDQAHQLAAEDAAPFTAAYDEASGQMQGDYGIAKQGAAEEARPTQDYYDRETQLYYRQQDFFQTQAELEQQAAANAHAEAQKHISAYEEQLAGVRQLMQTSGDPMGHLSFGEAAGLGFANFAQGFLAARGIHIDVSGQVDRWVDRKMAEHQQMIQNAREGANDQLHLYEIARQTSQDDYEARQRYRGFVIEGLKTSIQANAARFNSDVALARAKEQIAKLDIDAQKTKLDIFNRKYEMIHGFDSMRIQEAGTKGQLEIEQEKAQIERERNSLMKKAQAPQLVPIADPRDVQRDQTGKVVSGGKYKWAVDPKLAGEQGVKRVNEAGEMLDGIETQLDRLRDLRKTVEGKYGPHIWRDKTSEAYRLYDQQKQIIVASITKAFEGSRPSDEDRKAYAKWLRDDALSESGNNAQLVDNLSRYIHTKYDATMRNTVGVRPLTQEEASGLGYAQKVDTAPNDTALENANDAPARMPSSIEPFAGLPATEKAEPSDRKPSAFYQKNGPLPTVNNPYEAMHNRDARRTGGVVNTEDNWSVHLDDLARAAADPAKWLEGKSATQGDNAENPADVGLQAIDALKRIAHGQPMMENGPPPPKDRQEYAMKLLQALDKPDELLKQLE